jgi:hypothetical protein
MKEHVDNRHRMTSEGRGASAEEPNLQAMREMLFLESLYGDVIKLQVRRRKLGTALRLILFFGFLLLVWISMSLVFIKLFGS